jgi:hypothetical protein
VPLSATTTAPISSLHVSPCPDAFVYVIRNLTSQPACPLTWTGWLSSCW